MHEDFGEFAKMNTENMNIAKRAFEHSQQAFEDGNYELAQVYLLNAMTHHSDLKYLSSYPTIIKKLPASERNTYIDQAINLYSIALYNNPPEDIVQIMKLIEDLKKMMVAAGGDYSLDNGDDDFADASQTFAKFEEESKKFTWKNLISTGKIEDLHQLSARMDFFSNVSQAGANVPLYALSESQKRLLNNASQELQDTKTFVEYVSIRKSVEQYLEEAKSEIKKIGYNSQFAVCRLQQVNSLLSQLWLFDVVSVIGRENYVEQLNRLQKSCSAVEKEFLEKESEPLCRKIKSEIDSEISRGNKYSNNKLTSLLEILQKRYGEIATLIAELPLKSKIPEMQAELQKLAEKINELSKKRYAAYQKKCAAICRLAIQNFEDITWVWEKDAEEILRKNPLHTINEALISPETATILQMTKQMLEDKLSRTNKADFAVRCIEAEKMKLEDF